MNEFVKLAIWVVVIGAAFVFLWRKGILLRIANYVAETREELKKCNWPNYSELKGSTVVVMVAVGLLGIFTVVSDYVISQIIAIITPYK